MLVCFSPEQLVEAVLGHPEYFVKAVPEQMLMVAAVFAGAEAPVVAAVLAVEVA